VSPEQYFEMGACAGLPVYSGLTDTPFWPPFEEEVLSEDENSRVVRNGCGIVCRNLKDNSSMPQFLDFPVKTRDDWEQMKWRLDPDTPQRYPDWEELKKQYEGRDYVLQMTICGAYGLPRNLFGEADLALMYYDDPKLIHDILRVWLRLYKGMFSNTFPHVKPDFVFIWEDMAYKNGPLISPRMVEEFMLPYHTELIEHIKKLGVETVLVDSDGDIRLLIDIFLKAGANAIFPFEAAANMDPVATREKYGDSFLIWGGIDKRELSKDFASIEREVMKKVPKLMEVGGYIPSLDHACPPDISFENYKFYNKLVREICEGS